MSTQRKSCSFEISFDDPDTSPKVKTPVSSKRFLKSVDTPKKDPTEKMEEAIQRKSEIVQQTRDRCVAHNQRVKSVGENVIAKRDSLKAEIKENAEMRDELVSMRRRQTLEEKVEPAKKDLERVEHVRTSMVEDVEQKLNDITLDMANKENNRRSIIQGVKESCQSELDKVAQAQKRRASQSHEDNNEAE
ncbi:hypothetical protein Aperf_G00000113728 [Anoplocephala perfoliata]